jgi:hypothetical protein
LLRPRPDAWDVCLGGEERTPLSAREDRIFGKLIPDAFCAGAQDTFGVTLRVCPSTGRIVATHRKDARKEGGRDMEARGRGRYPMCPTTGGTFIAPIRPPPEPFADARMSTSREVEDKEGRGT